MRVCSRLVEVLRVCYVEGYLSVGLQRSALFLHFAACDNSNHVVQCENRRAVLILLWTLILSTSTSAKGDAAESHFTPQFTFLGGQWCTLSWHGNVNCRIGVYLSELSDMLSSVLFCLLRRNFATVAATTPMPGTRALWQFEYIQMAAINHDATHT